MEVPPPPDAGVPSAAERIAELEERIRGLESERARDVEALHAAQQSLANTQFELLEAISRADAAERRLRAADRPPEDAPPAEVAPAATLPSPARVGGVDPDSDTSVAADHAEAMSDALRARIARFQRDLDEYRVAADTPKPRDVTAAPRPVPEREVAPARSAPVPIEVAAPPLEPSSGDRSRSLRDRLAEAANARHRPGARSEEPADGERP